MNILAASSMITDIENLDHTRKLKLLDHLMGLMTEERRARFAGVISLRTRHMSIILEDIYQPHNASAVLRSCDCFGIQDVHIIENKNKYEVNPDVALGSAQWLTLYKYNQAASNTASCIRTLKEKGYRIIATSPHKNDFTPASLPLDSRFALIFGTELQGLSEEALALADQFIRIPMYGFTESLNISVSAAILLQSLTKRLRESEISWTLKEEEKNDVLLHWAACSVRKSDVVIRDFLKKNPA
ncbi:MAG: RNA methyltransferase [Bacteroidetes bacterium]|nr:RNA methyltransferase [Bacteroidota bacterium]